MRARARAARVEEANGLGTGQTRESGQGTEGVSFHVEPGRADGSVYIAVGQ